MRNEKNDKYHDKKDQFDPLGSYTGRGSHPDEKPVQDADDL